MIERNTDSDKYCLVIQIRRTNWRVIELKLTPKYRKSSTIEHGVSIGWFFFFLNTNRTNYQRNDACVKITSCQKVKIACDVKCDKSITSNEMTKFKTNANVLPASESISMQYVVNEIVVHLISVSNSFDFDNHIIS